MARHCIFLIFYFNLALSVMSQRDLLDLVCISFDVIKKNSPQLFFFFFFVQKNNNSKRKTKNKKKQERAIKKREKTFHVLLLLALFLFFLWKKEGDRVSSSSSWRPDYVVWPTIRFPTQSCSSFSLCAMHTRRENTEPWKSL